MTSPLDFSTPPRRILAIVVTRIGDTLLCTPALRALDAIGPGTAVLEGAPFRVELE